MNRLAYFILILIIVSCVGCTPTPENKSLEIIDDVFTPTVSVTGKLLPTIWANVSAQTGGRITKLMVSEGDAVAEGDVLVKLDDRDTVIAIKQAESTLEIANAQLVQLQTGPSAEEIQIVEKQVVAAHSVISQTQAQRTLLDAGGYTTQLAALKAQVAAAQSERFFANQQHEDAMKCYDVQQPDGSNNRICPTLGTIEEQTRMAMHAAEAALLSAETQLNTLYREHQAQIEIADSGIQAAQSQLDIAQAQLTKIKSPVTPQALAVAKARVDQAKVAVEMAHLSHEYTLVRAPFAGVIGYVYGRPGEFTPPGSPLLIIGDMTVLRVETTDLDEIDVAQIELGQNAIITFEALPDIIFNSSVDHIALMAQPGGGGVNYTVYLSLDKIHPQLRWGMTAFIDIETSQ